MAPWRRPAPAASAPLREHAARAGPLHGAAATVENGGHPSCRPTCEAETRLIATDLEQKFRSPRPTRDASYDAAAAAFGRYGA